MTQRSIYHDGGRRRVYLCTSRKLHCAKQWHVEVEQDGQVVYSSKPGRGETALQIAEQQSPRRSDITISEAARFLAGARHQHADDHSAPLFEVGG